MLTPNPMTPTVAKIRIFKSCDYAPERVNGKVHGSLVWEIKKYMYKKESKADEETLREKVRTVNDHYISDLRGIAMAGVQGQVEPITSGLKGVWS